MMKKLLLCFLILVSLVLMISGCDIIKKITGGEEHIHFGGEATCLKVAICDGCGESYGTRGEHSYVDATCSSPKTCTACGHTVGNKLSHEWLDATCTSQKRLSILWRHLFRKWG